MWNGVIGKRGVTGLNENGRYLFAALFLQRTPHHEYLFPAQRKYKWYRSRMDQKSLIDFCIVSSDLFSDVLDV